MPATGIATYNFAVVIVRNEEGKYLAVKETRNRGWWLPAGAVEPGESFEQAAIRETLEEAAIRIQLKGILRVERRADRDSARLRVVFYAVPDPPVQAPKSVPDKESDGAEWMTLQEFGKVKPKRGFELIEWGEYLEAGGTIYPLSALAPEDEEPTLGQLPFTLHSPQGSPAQSQPHRPGHDHHGHPVNPLLKAIAEGDMGEFSRLVAEGVDLNARDSKRWTPLHLALYHGSEQMVQVLLQKGADVCATTHKGRTPLHFAAASSASVLEKVLAFGGTSTALVRDKKGETAFHWAAKNSRHVYEILSNACGTDISDFAASLKDLSGKTPEDILEAED